MADQPLADAAPQPAPLPRTVPRRVARRLRNFFGLRKEVPLWQNGLAGLLCVALAFSAWWLVTRGEAEDRLVSYYMLPSPGETFAKFPTLWVDRELTRNTLVTLKRLALGFGLAALVGVPLGVLSGCYPRLGAFLAPVTLFGRNIPIAALIPLTMLVFGIDERQKMMFIFFATVAFIVSDTARAVRDVGSQYVDTAYTLGASRRQVILKVLVPLAMPGVFNSLRLLFGLAFGYIMLAELVRAGGEFGGLGNIINVSQHRGPTEHIFLVLLIIPMIALAIDRLLFWVQRELFPYRYGGTGILHLGVTAVFHGWDDVKSWFRLKGHS